MGQSHPGKAAGLQVSIWGAHPPLVLTLRQGRSEGCVGLPALGGCWGYSSDGGPREAARGREVRSSLRPACRRFSVPALLLPETQALPGAQRERQGATTCQLLERGAPGPGHSARSPSPPPGRGALTAAPGELPLATGSGAIRSGPSCPRSCAEPEPGLPGRGARPSTGASALLN